MPYTKVKRGRKGESPIKLQKICKSVIETKYFDGPNLVIPKSFNIQFKFQENFLVKGIFDKDLTVNINRTFSKINNLCNLVVYSKYTLTSRLNNINCIIQLKLISIAVILVYCL